MRMFTFGVLGLGLGLFTAAVIWAVMGIHALFLGFHVFRALLYRAGGAGHGDDSGRGGAGGYGGWGGGVGTG